MFKTIFLMLKREPSLPEGFVVEDVDKDASRAFLNSYSQQEKNLFYFVLAGWLTIAIALSSWLLYPYNNITEARFSSAFLLIVVPILGPVIWVYIRFNSFFKSLFFKQFAESHNLTFEKEGVVENIHGALFEIGDNRHYFNVFSGNLHNIPLKMFFYSYTTGSGKTKQAYNNTVCRLTYDFALPPILLVVDREFFGGISPAFKKSVKLKTEAELDKNFDLYTKDQYEIEALQLFNSDFIKQMLENWPNCNLEFMDNTVYIYTSGHLTNKAKMEKLFELGDFITDKLTNSLKAMSGSVKALNELEIK